MQVWQNRRVTTTPNSASITAGASPRPIKKITAPLAHKRSRKAAILFTKEEHRGSDQILPRVVGKVVQEQPNAAVKPASEMVKSVAPMAIRIMDFSPVVKAAKIAVTLVMIKKHT